MKKVIVPICKNTNGDISTAGDYKPIFLATSISKLFEHYILPCFAPFITDSLASSYKMG